MSPIALFIKKTKELEGHLKKDLPKEDREPYIETIQRLLEERQELLSQLPDLSDMLEESTKQDMISLENTINTLLSKKMSIIKQDLRVLQLQKNQNNQYENPYGNISADGMFLDKKK